MGFGAPGPSTFSYSFLSTSSHLSSVSSRRFLSGVAVSTCRRLLILPSCGSFALSAERSSLPIILSRKGR